MQKSYWIIGILIFIAGLSASVLVGNDISTRWEFYPSIHDLVLERLPYLDLFFIGEMLYWLVLATYLLVYAKYDRQRIPYVLMIVGLYYLLRCFFLVLLPLGHPIDAPVYDERLSIYPQYAYFPSGHIGFLTVITLGLPQFRLRRWFWVYVLLFGFGMILTRAHYTVDILGAIVIAYAVFAFAQKHLAPRWFTSSPQK